MAWMSVTEASTFEKQKHFYDIIFFVCGEMAFGSIIPLFVYLVVFYFMFTTPSFWTNGW